MFSGSERHERFLSLQHTQGHQQFSRTQAAMLADERTGFLIGEQLAQDAVVPRQQAIVADALGKARVRAAPTKIAGGDQFGARADIDQCAEWSAAVIEKRRTRVRHAGSRRRPVVRRTAAASGTRPTPGGPPGRSSPRDRCPFSNSWPRRPRRSSWLSCAMPWWTTWTNVRC